MTHRTPLTATTDVLGDKITVIYQPHNLMWLSPTHGEQFDTAADAMRAELRAYMLECGQDLDTVADEIESYVADMRRSDTVDCQCGEIYGAEVEAQS